LQNEKALEEQPLVVVSPDTGIRFGIDQELFDRWRKGIPPEDQEGFVFYGGDIGLAKFVCCFDYLTHRKRVPHAQAIVQAYAAAFDLDPSSYTCRTRGYEAFDHPAVQFLLEQFATQGLRDARENAMPKYTKLLDHILTKAAAEEKIGKQIAALDAATRFYKMMQSEGQKQKSRPAANPRVINRKPVRELGVVDAALNAPADEPESE
jgi:hypothetical protein